MHSPQNESLFWALSSTAATLCDISLIFLAGSVLLAEPPTHHPGDYTLLTNQQPHYDSPVIFIQSWSTYSHRSRNTTPRTAIVFKSQSQKEEKKFPDATLLIYDGWLWPHGRLQRQKMQVFFFRKKGGWVCAHLLTIHLLKSESLKIFIPPTIYLQCHLQLAHSKPEERQFNFSFNQ